MSCHYFYLRETSPNALGFDSSGMWPTAPRRWRNHPRLHQRPRMGTGQLRVTISAIFVGTDTLPTDRLDNLCES